MHKCTNFFLCLNHNAICSRSPTFSLLPGPQAYAPHLTRGTPVPPWTLPFCQPRSPPLLPKQQHSPHLYSGLRSLRYCRPLDSVHPPDRLPQRVHACSDGPPHPSPHSPNSSCWAPACPLWQPPCSVLHPNTPGGSPKPSGCLNQLRSHSASF